jgi:NAD(P)-dependent dehydrogenase (short-subunit alcohol dehydrogenase family)
VITGGSAGIGLETAAVLAQAGARVIGVGRDRARCNAARAWLKDRTGSGDIHFEVADLASQHEVRALARRLSGKCRCVDVLINNAGVFTSTYQVSAEGVELQFAVNYLAGFLLTRELLPLLAASEAARVIGVSSGSHFAGKIHWADVGMRRRYFGLAAYDQSKLAVVMFCRELARRLGPRSRITTYSVDPGLVKTDIGAKRTGFLVRAAWRLRTRKGVSAEDAAASVAFLAMDPGAASLSGMYWNERQPLPSSEASLCKEDARRLWELSERLCGADSLPKTAIGRPASPLPDPAC